MLRCQRPYCGGQYLTLPIADSLGRTYETSECSLCGYPPGGEAAMEARRQDIDRLDPPKCASGRHALVGDNVYLKRGKAACRSCFEYARNAQQRRRAREDAASA